MDEETHSQDAGAAVIAETAPAAIAGPAKFWAHSDIEHDGQVIKRGAEMPAKFPVDSLARLLRRKSIGKTPPPESGPTITRGPTAALIAPPQTTTDSVATDGTP